MCIDVYRDYCLSLGADVEEKLPFVKFKNGEGVLVFYSYEIVKAKYTKKK